jgi:hypothetical protein
MEMIQYSQISTNKKLNDLLQEKFVEISIELKKILKTASKGERKGLLIFTTEAPKIIYQIEDRFVQYIIRSIFDNYSDFRNGVLFRMHCNEIFSLGYIQTLFTKLNSNIAAMEKEKESLNDKYNTSNFQEIKRLKFSRYYSRNPENVFNKLNPVSEAFYKAFKALKEQVKKDHPRVPDDKLSKYIQNNYDYRKLYEDIEKNYLSSFPEYITLENEIDLIYNNKIKEEREINGKIKIELETMDYTAIKKELERLIQLFINTITTNIINGILK